MPSNIEIKARLIPGGFEAAEALAKNMCDTGESFQILHQKDEFFHPSGDNGVDNGRVKLRTENGESHLITYFRKNATGPKLSTYSKVPVENVNEKLMGLPASWARLGIVEKVRKVYIMRWPIHGMQARIHLDKVVGLGDFLEFEVQLRADNKDQMLLGEHLARELQELFQIKDEDLIEGSYLDLLTAKYGEQVIPTADPEGGGDANIDDTVSASEPEQEVPERVFFDGAGDAEPL